MTYIFNEIGAVLILVYLIGALLLRGRFRNLSVWAIMLFASALTILLGLLPIDEYAAAINFDVIFFLIGMFSLVATADSSGALKYIALKMLRKAKNTWYSLLIISFTFGLLAAVAMNDTMALMGPVIIVVEAKSLDIDIKPLTLLLIFSVSIGSVMSPIGNPQNMLITSESDLHAPFLYFGLFLLLPTLINLYITTLIVTKLYRIQNKPIELKVIPIETIQNRKNACVSLSLILLTITTFIINDTLAIMNYPHITHIGFIPFVYASIMYLVATERREILAKVDWSTILFFLGMFITMEGIWRSGLFQSILQYIPINTNDYLNTILVVSFVSLTLSQLLSNVPMVKLYIDYLHFQGITGQNIVVWITLAMASTIAGNLTIFGAASNIIVIEIMESKYNQTISYTEFFKVGLLVTLINVFVYCVFIYILAVFLL